MARHQTRCAAGNACTRATQPGKGRRISVGVVCRGGNGQPVACRQCEKHCCGDACLTQHGPRCRPVRGGRTMQQVASRDGLLLFNALKRSLQLSTSHTVHMQTSATYQGTARGRGVQQQQAQREHVTQRRRTASGSAAAAGSAGSKPLPAYWSAMKRKRKRWQDACRNFFMLMAICGFCGK